MAWTYISYTAALRCSRNFDLWTPVSIKYIQRCRGFKVDIHCTMTFSYPLSGDVKVCVPHVKKKNMLTALQVLQRQSLVGQRGGLTTFATDREGDVGELSEVARFPIREADPSKGRPEGGNLESCGW